MSDFSFFYLCFFVFSVFVYNVNYYCYCACVLTDSFCVSVSVPPSSSSSSSSAKPEPVNVKSSPSSSGSSSGADILVAGSVALDLSCDYMGAWGPGNDQETQPQMHTSNPACINQSVGGVGHNVALAAHMVSENTNVRLCSLIGDDV